MATRTLNSSSARLLIAGILVIALLIWIGGGDVTVSQADGATPVHEIADHPLPKVRTEHPAILSYQPTLSVAGVVAPSRQLWLQSERSGIVRNVRVQEGQWVKANTLIAQLDTRQLEAQRTQVKTLLRSRELDFKAAQNLQGKGLVAETRFAESASALADAQAQLTTLELALEASEIRAPFAGYLNSLTIELGQYLNEGQNVAELLDFEPTLVRGALTEQQLHRLGDHPPSIEVDLLHGDTYKASLHFQAMQADLATRMVQVDVALAQRPLRPVASTTAEIRFSLPAQQAHQLSPALFNLDPAGNLGFKVVNKEQRVVFWPTELLGTDNNGFWVPPLPEELRLITVGQGYVSNGDQVAVSEVQSQP